MFYSSCSQLCKRAEGGKGGGGTIMVGRRNWMPPPRQFKSMFSVFKDVIHKSTATAPYVYTKAKPGPEAIITAFFGNLDKAKIQIPTVIPAAQLQLPITTRRRRTSAAPQPWRVWRV